MSKNKHVAVLMGGWSAEREVSLNSGKACGDALQAAGYKVTFVDVEPDIARVLDELKPDVAFNALHGKWGEDGCVQGILETLRIPYTHSGVLASALSMHKPLAKTVFAEHKLPMAEHKIADRIAIAAGSVMPPPYVIKPLDEGSSVGVHIVMQESDLGELDLVSEKNYGELCMVERFVHGRELTCAVMGDVALGIIDIVPATNFYDYEAKYAPGGSKHVLPAEIPADVYRQVQRYALTAHQALGCRGVSRADFRYDDTAGAPGELVILEINTQPGMTGTSLVPEIAEHAGHSFEELVSWMVEDASCDR